MVKQIKLVATGYCESVEQYMSSEACVSDNVGYIIDRDGTLTHLRNTTTIAIVNAGPVALYKGKWIPATMDADGRFVPIPGAAPIRVPYEYCSCNKYHGCQYYEMMGGKQLRPLTRLLKEVMEQYGITYPYDNQLGGVCQRAISGGSGIYLASSYNQERSDIHPQVELINIIKSLAS